MRPVTLEVEGFASFRDPAEVDFEGADLFVLSGRTGAGKSSLIDAIVFSLYGTVPRYDDRRLVAPVITQGLQQARVRFTFDLDGERYAATRVVRRTKTGATTKEARLERVADDQVVAGTADELTEAIERLIGLGFEHFTRTVVLPQGEFQEFLHAKPKQRQDLLVELLDLDVYRRVAKRANQRSKEAAATAGVLRARLDDELAGATEEAVEAATARLHALDHLDERCTEVRPELERLVTAGQEARQRHQQAAARLGAVAELSVSDGVEELHGEVRAATQAVDEASESVEKARTACERAEEVADGLPAPAEIQALVGELDRRDGLAQQLETARERVTAAAGAVESAEALLGDAEAEHERAAAALRELEHQHIAHTLRADLETGDPCPVCSQPVEELPTGDAPPDVEHARTAVGAADRLVKQRRRVLESARGDAKAAVTTADDLTTRLKEVRARLESQATELGLPTDRDVLGQRLEAATAAVTALAEAREAERTARGRLQTAERNRDGLAQREQAAWRAFDTARDRLAGVLGPRTPPSPDRDDLAGAWEALVVWTGDLRPQLETEAAEAEQAIEQAETRYRRTVDELLADVTEQGIEVEGRDPERILKAVTTACAQARAAKERAGERFEQATEARKQLAETERDAAVAGELGTLLDARHFEQWLLNRALRHLVVGASAILGELTSGAYSLSVDADGSFGVVDHRNADEVRSARTLSGGETFLASLSLALALAEHVAELAAHGSARLEALFLDEGFGTLDTDTLDTVAAAIEELGSKGRTVGLVTHVRDLAERIPVRFEVRRTATTSTVERIER